jgi:hypothetical protein
MSQEGQNAVSAEAAPEVAYNVTVLPVTIYFNRDGDHDHNGMMFALTDNVPILKYIEAMGKADRPGGSYPPPPSAALVARADLIGVSLPATPAQARQPHPLVRPLVLRARKNDEVTVTLHNEIHGKMDSDRPVGIHLVAGGYDVRQDDGSHVGNNPSSLVSSASNRIYHWHCVHEGVFPFHDGGNYSGGEDGTNVHGLFGALIVEPENTKWRDPVTGRVSHDAGDFIQLDGLYLDVMPMAAVHTEPAASGTNLGSHTWPPPVEYFTFGR